MLKNRRDRCLFVSLTAALVVLCAAFPAHAAPSCHSLSATAVGFGNYNVYGSGTQMIPGTISYNCPPPTAATISIDGGQHASSSARAMSNGVDLLVYDIFSDNCRTRWVPGVPAPVAAGSGSISFFACITLGQDVSVGTYSDTITVTFNF